MKKVIVLLLAAILLLAGCGQEPETEAKTEPTREAVKPMVSMYDLRTAMTAAQPGLPDMTSVSSSDENAEGLFAYLSDLSYDKVEGFFLTYSSDGKTANEIAVICLKDPADLPALEASLKAHIKGRVDLYKTYAPDQVEQASAAEVVTQGRYMALIMCSDRAAVKAAFVSGVQ
ncbi:MAG: DUF4358 domain-containing protein [Oscillospiraceae bacterium]|nr:DUF4358 domain-containing protein [Oscillospiraceae bacterium]